MTFPKFRPTHDVIITGAGPVGLFLACELALQKCSVLLLEKSQDAHTPLKKLPFGIRGLSAPSIETLARRGLLPELEIHKHLKNPHQGAKQGAQRQVGHFAGIAFVEGNVDVERWGYRLPSSTPPSLISEIHELETVFTRRAEASGVEIRRGITVTGFTQSDDGVVVEAENQSFHGKWLVGCDGSRSVVRHVGGFEFAGTEPEFTGYSIKADLADPGELKPGRVVTERGMYLHSQPGYLNVQDVDGGAFHGSGKPVTREHVQEVLRRVSGTDVTLTTLHLATTWTDRARQATTYRKGRVFLGGDAAHIHAPLGGQGLNLGLGDAMNLGWKLATVIRGKALESLLDTYHNERYPVGMQVLDWSRAQAEVMKLTPGARAINAILRDLMETRDGATYFAGRVWGINTHYDIDGKHPLVGRSVPNFEYEDSKTLNDLMHDGRYVLLDFRGDDDIKQLVNDYDGEIKYISGPAKEQRRLIAALARPDGIVIWATDDVSDVSEMKTVVDHWLCSE